MKRILLFLAPAVTCLMLVSSALAITSQVYVYSTIDYDTATDTVTGYTYTSPVTFGGSVYYQPIATAVVYDQDYNYLTDGYQFQSEGGAAEITMPASGYGCQYYHIIGYHAVDAYYYVTGYYSHGSPIDDGFYDRDYYSYYEETPFYDTSPDYTLYGNGPWRIRYDEVIGLAQTEVWGSGDCSPPTATPSAIKAVGKDQKALVHVVVDNPNNDTITLNIAPLSGTTGAAKFTGTGGTNNSTRTISVNGTGAVDVEITGVTESSTVGNMRLKATFTNQSSQTVTIGSIGFTVISVSLELKLTGSVDNDNARKTIISNENGRITLGIPAMNNGNRTPYEMSIMIEIIATILPTNFDSEVKMNRQNIETRFYDDTSNPDPFKRYVGCDDSSSFYYQDNDPTSGVAGKVYDVDVPGLFFPDLTSNGSKLRRRVNFVEWVSVYQSNGTSNAAVRVSDDITWFQRLSIVKNGNSDYSTITDASTSDNQIGSGATPLTWNLGTSAGTLPTPSTCPSPPSPQVQ